MDRSRTTISHYPGWDRYLKGAPHRKVAERFVDFVLSKTGQNLWTQPLGSAQGPQRYNIQRMSLLCSPPSSSEFLYDSHVASQRWNSLNEWMGRCLIDLHADLQNAYQTIQKMPPSQRNEAEATLFQPVMTEDEFHETFELSKTNRSQAEKIYSSWMKKSREKYLNLNSAEDFASKSTGSTKKAVIPSFLQK